MHKPFRPRRRAPDSQRAVQRGAADAQPAPLAGDADSGGADRLRRWHRHARRQRRSSVAVGCRNSSVRRQHFHAGPVFLQRRWRAADRSASWAADVAHRVRRARSAARARRPHPARHQVPRRASRRLSSRLHLRELRTASPPAGPRPYRHVRAGERARLPGAGCSVRGS